MKILIVRNGSGWGGPYGVRVLDSVTGVVSVLADTCRQIDTMQILKSYDAFCERTYLLSTSTSYLRVPAGYTLMGYSVMFDAQDDYVYCLDGDEFYYIYSAEYKNANYPEYYNWISRLIDYVWEQDK